MRIGLISDTHDDLSNLKAALEVLQDEGVAKVLHCGDICGLDTVRALAGLAPTDVSQSRQNGFDIWIAQGNMDRHLGLSHAVDHLIGPGRLAWLHRLTLGGYSLAMIHGDNEGFLDGLIGSGKYAYVLHGHTHRRRDQTVGGTRVINPGALGGMHRQGRSLGILDLTTAETHFVKL